MPPVLCDTKRGILTKMALPPTIPTSFVPYSASATARRLRTDFIGAFGFFAYGVLGLAVILALGVFLYGRILDGTLASKDAALAKAEAAIDPATVASFVQLRNRLTSSQSLLNAHPALSNFFSVLEKTLPATARFSKLHLTLGSGNTAKLDAAGVAKNFNVLAALSAAFATDGRIKDAIFSNIIVSQKDNSVSFVLTATLAPDLIAFTPSSIGSALPESAPPASTTPQQP